MNNHGFSRRSFLKSSILVSAGLFIPKAFRTIAQPTRTDNVVEGLANRYFTPITSANDAENWLQTWQSLDFEQLESFNILVAKYALELNEGRETDINTKKVEIAKNMRSDVNKRSMEVYGVPFNRLSGDEFNDVIDYVWNSGYHQLVNNNLDGSTLATCSCYSYPYLTVPGGSGSPTNSTGRIRAANTGECGDCDLEIIFPVNRQILRHVTPAGYVYYSYTGGVLYLRRTPTTSRILIGYSAVLTIFLGVEYAAQIAYRLV